MTAFPNSPRLLKGALVGVNLLNPSPASACSNNPDTMTGRLVAFNVRRGSQDLGFRSEVPILSDCRLPR